MSKTIVLEETIEALEGIDEAVQEDPKFKTPAPTSNTIMITTGMEVAFSKVKIHTKNIQLNKIDLPLAEVL